jgi:hypothetical protein
LAPRDIVCGLDLGISWNDPTSCGDDEPVVGLQRLGSPHTTKSKADWLRQRIVQSIPCCTNHVSKTPKW